MPAYSLPPLGHNPSSRGQGTTPGSFANGPEVGGPRSFSSPDTPGMPLPSEKTAWDFLPRGWQRDSATGFATAPAGFEPSPSSSTRGSASSRREMRRVAEREPHLTAEQVRDEVAAGRMIIPANTSTWATTLDPMAIGRASDDQDQREHGRVAGLERRPTKRSRSCSWAERWGADTVMDLSTGGDLDATREAIIRASTVPIGTVPIYSMIIGRKHRGSRRAT